MQITEEKLMTNIEESRELIEKGGGSDFGSTMIVHYLQYYYSWGIRGDNTHEYAEYLGYLNSKELYPDFKPVKFEDFFKDILSGKARRVYERRR